MNIKMADIVIERWSPLMCYWHCQWYEPDDPHIRETFGFTFTMWGARRRAIKSMCGKLTEWFALGTRQYKVEQSKRLSLQKSPGGAEVKHLELKNNGGTEWVAIIGTALVVILAVVLFIVTL